MTIAEKLTRAKADIDAVYEAGKKAEYDEFWDALQENGKRTIYNRGFSSNSWNDKTFFPKYDIKPSYGCVGTFLEFGVTDLEARLKECGVILDLSNNANYSQTFASAKCKILPEIAFSGFTSTTYATFQNCTALHTIRKIILKDDFNATMSDAFNKCTALENVVFEGVIPKNISLAQSVKLSKASITNIVECLSTTASGQTATFSKTAVDTAFETTAGAGDGSTSAEWQSLIAPKSNWTISLV